MFLLTLFLTGSLLFLPDTGNTADLGTYGSTYPIAERDIREVFIQGLKEVFSEKNQKKAALKLKEKIEEFDLYLPEVKKEKTWKVDTTFQLKTDITDPEGKVIARAGTYDLFDYILPVDKTYVFIDGRKERELNFARELKKTRDITLILTAGNVLKVKKKGFLEVYQASPELLSRWGIKAVPAVVEVKGKEIIAREVKLSR